jgi:ribosome maturation factor RimP
MEILEETLKEELKKVCDPLDLEIVELSAKRGKNGLNIKAVIYRGSGVTIRDCEKVSILFNNRLSILGPIDDENYSLQVSSPGLYREFKDSHEYSLFLTRPVKLILKEPDPNLGNAVCLTGILEGYIDNTVVLNENGIMHRIPLSRIKKTKLNG